jgi:hypothetical protein
LATLDADPLEVLSGDLDHRPELPILMALTAEAAEQVNGATLQRWMRASGPHGCPVDLLTGRDFAAFEDALDGLRRRGFVVRGGGPGRAG